MIVLLGSQKGGCGKSSVLVNLAAILIKKGSSVVMVDADRQATSARWAQDRTIHLDVSQLRCVQLYGDLSGDLQDLALAHDFVFVDVAARDNVELRTAMAVADTLIVPFKASQADLDTLPIVNEIVSQAHEINPGLKVYALLNMVSTNPRVQEVHESKEYLSTFPVFQPLVTVIRDRKIYKDSLSEGLGVVESRNAKARREIESLVEELQW